MNYINVDTNYLFYLISEIAHFETINEQLINEKNKICLNDQSRTWKFNYNVITLSSNKNYNLLTELYSKKNRELKNILIDLKSNTKKSIEKELLNFIYKNK